MYDSNPKWRTTTSEQFLFKSKQKNSTQDVLVHKNKVQILGKSFL